MAEGETIPPAPGDSSSAGEGLSPVAAVEDVEVTVAFSVRRRFFCGVFALMADDPDCDSGDAAAVDEDSGALVIMSLWSSRRLVGGGGVGADSTPKGR